MLNCMGCLICLAASLLRGLYSSSACFGPIYLIRPSRVRALCLSICLSRYISFCQVIFVNKKVSQKQSSGFVFFFRNLGLFHISLANSTRVSSFMSSVTDTSNFGTSILKLYLYSTTANGLFHEYVRDNSFGPECGHVRIRPA
jgi:hypothetical protein